MPGEQTTETTTATTTAAPPSTTTTTATPPVTTSTTSTEPETSLLNVDDNEPAPKGEVPEAYGEFKVPDGYTLDAEAVAKAAPIFKELGLTQEQAQKLVDLYSASNQSSIDRLYNQMRDVRKGWQTETNAYLEANGGAKQARADIGKALNVIFTGDKAAEQMAGFRKFMDQTGAGDNPYFVQAFHTMSKRFVEGTSVSGANPSVHGQTEPGNRERPSLAEAIYPPRKPATPGG